MSPAQPEGAKLRPSPVNPGELRRVLSDMTGYHGLPRDAFTERQGQGLAALVAVATLQVLAATPLSVLGDDTEILTAEDVLRAAA